MTDLSAAYAGFSDNEIQPQFPSAPTVQSMSLPPVVQQPPPPAPKQMVSVQQPSEVVYQPPEAMYAQQPAQPMPQEESFLDRLSAHRYDVLKVTMFAFVILLAFALHDFFGHYLTKYLSDSVLTNTQELLVRLGYPVAVILVVWFVKAM